MNNDPNESTKGLTDKERRALQVTCPECGLTEWASVEIWRPSFSAGKVRCPNCGHTFHDSKIPISHIQRARRETMERAAGERRAREREARRRGVIRRYMIATMGKARFYRYLNGVTPNHRKANELLLRLRDAIEAGAFDAADHLVRRVEELSISKSMIETARPVDPTGAVVSAFDFPPDLFERPEPMRSSVFEPEVRRASSPLKGAILSAVSRGFTPGPGQTEPIPFTRRVERPEELGLESVTYDTTKRTFPVDVESFQVPEGDHFLDWINETIESDGLEEEEPEETARFRRFFMGETTERVDLIVHGSDGREKKRFTLEGCRCSDSPLQRLSRGEPPFDELEDGSITITPCAVSYLRPFERASDSLGAISHTEGVLVPPGSNPNHVIRPRPSFDGGDDDE